MAGDIGIDLGTASVLVFVKGKGITLCEPSVVALDKLSGKILAVGSEAQSMLAAGPWYALFTGLTIVFLVFGVGLIGEGLQAQSREVD